MAITKQTCKNFREDLNAALAALSIKYNLDIQAGNIRFSDTTLAVKLDCTQKGSANESAGQAQFNAYCAMYLLKPEDFGKEFTDARGDRHRIVGIKKRTKYPILTRNITKNGEGTVPTNKWDYITVRNYIQPLTVK